MGEELSDQELLEGFRHPDSRNYYFNLLVRKYQERVYHHVRRILISHDDADDVTQETFVRIWSKLDQFQGNSALFTWIYRIATNEALTLLRKKRRRFFIPISSAESELSESLHADISLKGDAVQFKLQAAIIKLPEKQRLVFNMKYFEDLTYEEISEVLGTSVGALKASYHHAVKKIETILKNS